MTKRLVLVRHVRPAGVQAARLLGSTDIPLDSRGIAAARVLADRIHCFAPQVCCSSPLTRCRQTAEAVVERLRAGGRRSGEVLPTVYDADLREIDFGRWENCTFDDVATKEPELVAGWAKYDDEFAFPGGECLGEFNQRVRRAAERLASQAAETVLVVTHGGVIRTLICHYLGLDARQYVLFDVGYGAVVVIELFDGKGVLRMN